LFFFEWSPGDAEFEMQVAVISDVHANLEALQAVLKEVRGLGTYCLGDLVDYGADPNEVVELLKEHGAFCLRGNHDEAVLTGDTSLMNYGAAASSKWTRDRLTTSTREFLAGLPSEKKLKVMGNDVYFAHGSPDDSLWEYVDPATHSGLFGGYLESEGVGTIGLGHTHVPFVWRGKEGTVFNPGSVGQPRDGDRRASFAVMTARDGKTDLEIRRVEYDFRKAAEKIRAAGLPEFFADRLADGV
jgi:predicted phosphodiesterase